METKTIPIRAASRAHAPKGQAPRGSPFASSMEHVLAELQWVELLVREQLRKIQTGPHAENEYKGLVISDEEIADLLARPPASLAFSADGGAGPEGRWAGAVGELRTSLDERMAASQEAGVKLRLPALQRTFALSAFELQCILLCLATELDLRFERFYAYLQDDVTRKYLTINLALNLLCGSLREKIEARTHFSPHGALQQHALVRVLEDPSHAGDVLLSRTLRLDEGITAYLLGSEDVDPRLREFARRVEPTGTMDDVVAPAEMKYKLEALVLRQSSTNCTRVMHLWGAEGSGRMQTATALCRSLGGEMLYVDVRAMLSAPENAVPTELVRSVREAKLQGNIPYLDHFDLLLAEDKTALRRRLLRAIQEFRSVVFLATKDAWHPTTELDGCEFISAAFKVPDFAARTELWKRELPAEVSARVDLSELASKFKFNGGQIRSAAEISAQIARWRDPENGVIEVADLHEGCRIHSSRQLADLGRKIKPHHTWTDIVLPEDRTSHLREICNCVRYRSVVFDQWGFDRKLSLGKGLNMLFAGPSGTGKTMAAEIMAGEVGLEVYKIDLSTIVSKYIGETEKNLARIFAGAEASNAILFFDEADALFGKRTEVRDSHDRYANIEVNYLLQKLEEHEGVVILATNFRRNMDDAFVRRLHFTVEFPVPCEGDRLRIWQKIWPQETPISADIDLDFMARRFEIPGGNIRNVALAAAFLAASDGGVVTMHHLLHGTRREYQKMGKVVSHGEFGYQEPN